MSSRAARYETLVTRLLGLSLLLFGSLFVALGGQRFARYRQTAGWPAVPGEMISLPPHLRYSYRVDGAIHHGTRVRLESGRSRSASAGPLSPGSGSRAIPIHYDPDHPESAVLERESLAPGVLLAVAGLAPILGGAFLLRRRRAAATARAVMVRGMGAE
ncbi:MAG: DUF3592 domain-containing protein [Gemmatimonadota bacterium]|nr:DUF3592 domain-containing protein [Gemmatimonadota bacterium]